MKPEKTKSPSQELAKFVLRMTDDLRDQYREIAVKNHRSMNQEMVAALENYADRMNTLDILIQANREMLMRASESTYNEANNNVVKLLQVTEH